MAVAVEDMGGPIPFNGPLSKRIFEDVEVGEGLAFVNGRHCPARGIEVNRREKGVL